MAALDRISVSVEWDATYPLSRVNILPKGVSDQNPVAITFGDKLQIKDPIFRFECWWLEIEGFSDLVKKVRDTECQASDPLDVWKFKIRLLRKKVKGCSRNIEAQLKKTKSSPLDEIYRLDLLSEQHMLYTQERDGRKKVWIDLERILRMEEITTRQRSREREREKLKREIRIQPISLLRPIKGSERRQYLV
jgi:hypothetical protein